MNVSQLVNFIKLSEVGNFSRASTELFISQQGLSHSIRTLEDELHIRLFDRTNRGVQLNDYGRIVYRYATHIVNDYHDMLDELDGKRRSNSTELSVGLPFGIYAAIPFNTLIAFQEQHPEIQLQSRFYVDWVFEKDMVGEQTDVAIANVASHLGREKVPDQFEYIKLAENTVCLTVNKEHPLAAREEVTIKDLSGMRVAVFGSKFFNDKDILTEDCEENGVTDVHFYECSEQDYLIQYVSKNYGGAISVLSLNGSQKSHNTVDIPFADKRKYRYDICLLIPRNKRRTYAINVFTDYIRRVFRQFNEKNE